MHIEKYKNNFTSFKIWTTLLVSLLLVANIGFAQDTIPKDSLPKEELIVNQQNVPTDTKTDEGSVSFVITKLKDVAGDLMDVLPSLIGALLVLFLGWLFAKIFSGIVERLLKAVRIDILAERINQIDMLQGSNIEIKPSIVIARILYYIIMLIVIAVAADLMALKILSNQVEGLINYIPNLITAGLIMILGLLLANMIKELLNTTFKSLGMTSGSLISNIIFYFLFITIALTALKQALIETEFIEINITIIIAGIMLAFAIGYGYASRGVMANFLGSLYSKPKFRVGETVKVKETKGVIIGMDSTSMILRTANNKRMVIPLSVLTQEQVEIFESWDEGTLIEDGEEE